MIDTEVCVIGGGPAGCTVAQRLADLGHEVCLVERAAFPRPHVGESLPPSIIPLLDRLGLRQRVERAGFLRPARALVQWGAPRTFVAFDSGALGFQVDRAHFDLLLLAGAREAGVRVIQPVMPHGIQRIDGRWRVPLRHAAGTIRADVVVDATGRQGVLPRSRRRVRPATAALYAYWVEADIRGSETRVEAGEAAWYWGAPLPSGVFNATVFVDPRVCAGLTAADRERRYRELLSRSPLLSACLSGRQLGPVRVCDATPFVDDCPITADSIKVGEAALAIDPLSSQGVQNAMTSGFQAAAAIHTIRSRPDRTDLAVAFYQASVRDAAASHARLAADAYRTALPVTDSEFWRRRAAPASAPLTARARLPIAPTVTVSPLAHIVPAPVLVGDEILPGRSVRHPNLERPVAFLVGHQLAPLLEAVSRQGQPLSCADVVALWSTHVPPAAAGQILQWMWERGLVEGPS